MTQAIPLVWTQSVATSSFWPPTHMTEHSGMHWQGSPCSPGTMRTRTCHSGLGTHTIKHVSMGYLPWAGRDTALAVTKSSASDTHTATRRMWMCVREGGQMIKKLVWAAYKTKRDCDLNLHHAAVVTLNVDIQWASERRKSLAVWLEYAILNSLTGSWQNVCAWAPTTYFIFL